MSAVLNKTDRWSSSELKLNLKKDTVIPLSKYKLMIFCVDDDKSTDNKQAKSVLKLKLENSNIKY